MRLRNVKTNMVVNVADSKAERFGSDWVPADDAPPDDEATKTTTAKKPAAKK